MSDDLVRAHAVWKDIKDLEGQEPLARALQGLIDVDKLRALLKSVPEGPWLTYSWEGPWRNGTRQTHSVCKYNPKHIGSEEHECIASGVGDDEAKAYHVANFIAEAHTLLTGLLAALDKAAEKDAK